MANHGEGLSVGVKAEREGWACPRLCLAWVENCCPDPRVSSSDGENFTDLLNLASMSRLAESEDLVEVPQVIKKLPRGKASSAKFTLGCRRGCSNKLSNPIWNSRLDLYPHRVTEGVVGV